MPTTLLPPHCPHAGGKIGLIDYGQSKRLPDNYRAAFAQLVLALEKGDEGQIAQALGGIGVVTDRHDPPLQAKLAYGMFDTSGKGVGGVRHQLESPTDQLAHQHGSSLHVLCAVG